LEIDHELDESSIEQDDFLEVVQKEEKMMAANSNFKTTSTVKTLSELLLVDRTHISLTLLEGQSVRECVAFTNPTASPIRMRLDECPFQVQSDTLLGFVSAGQLQVVIEPWDRVELIFAVQQASESYGDVIETVVVMGEFVGRGDIISPVSIQFHVKFVSPRLTLRFEGSSDVVDLLQGRMAVANIKVNKLGEYELEITLGEGLSKLAVTIETRGKATASMQSATLRSGEPTRIKLRERGQRMLGVRERCGLMLKPENSRICFVMGVNFML
jgi:hypothetical protein